MTDEEKAKIIAEAKAKNNIESLIGFAARAGKLVTGADKICDEIRRHGVPEGESKPEVHGLVILASDASQNTEKRLRNSCEYYNVAIRKSQFTASELGSKAGRSDCAAVAVFDRDFKRGLLEALGANE